MTDSSQPYGPGRDPRALGETFSDVLGGIHGAAEVAAARAALGKMLDPATRGDNPPSDDELSAARQRLCDALAARPDNSKPV